MGIHRLILDHRGRRGVRGARVDLSSLDAGLEGPRLHALGRKLLSHCACLYVYGHTGTLVARWAAVVIRGCRLIGTYPYDRLADRLISVRCPYRRCSADGHASPFGRWCGNGR